MSKRTAWSVMLLSCAAFWVGVVAIVWKAL